MGDPHFATISHTGQHLAFWKSLKVACWGLSLGNFLNFYAARERWKCVYPSLPSLSHGPRGLFQSKVCSTSSPWAKQASTCSHKWACQATYGPHRHQHQRSNSPAKPWKRDTKWAFEGDVEEEAEDEDEGQNGGPPPWPFPPPAWPIHLWGGLPPPPVWSSDPWTWKLIWHQVRLLWLWILLHGTIGCILKLLDPSRAVSRSRTSSKTRALSDPFPACSDHSQDLPIILFNHHIRFSKTSRRTGNRAHRCAHFVQKGWFCHSAELISDVGNLAKSEAPFLPFHRHRCNACTVFSWQPAFLWMHLHCQALAYTI